MRYFLLALFIFPIQSWALTSEAFVARVGRQGILLSDLVRFKEVERIMSCAKLREVKEVGVENFQSVLNRFIEEELMYQESTSKKNQTNSQLRRAVEAIQAKSSCLKEWQQLGQRFSALWASASRPREGEFQLVRELEKRLTVGIFEKDQIQGDRAAWVRGARIKTSIELFID
jgi:hypothetical protein